MKVTVRQLASVEVVHDDDFRVALQVSEAVTKREPRFLTIFTNNREDSTLTILFARTHPPELQVAAAPADVPPCFCLTNIPHREGVPILLTETTSSCGAKPRPGIVGTAAAVPVGARVPCVAARPLQDPAGLVMVATTVVAGAIARAPRHALLATPRSISPSVLLAAAAAAAVVVAVAGPGP